MRPGNELISFNLCAAVNTKARLPRINIITPTDPPNCFHGKLLAAWQTSRVNTCFAPHSSSSIVDYVFLAHNEILTGSTGNCIPSSLIFFKNNNKITRRLASHFTCFIFKCSWYKRAQRKLGTSWVKIQYFFTICEKILNSLSHLCIDDTADINAKLFVQQWISFVSPSLFVFST